MKMPIDSRAPVTARATIEIEAPVEAVWRVLTAIEDWPGWQKDVSEALVVGQVREGAVFRWKAGGIRFTSGVHTMVPGREFGWTGQTLGASAIHNWRFEPDGDRTVVTVEESLDGVFPKLFTGFFQRSLDAGIRRSLEELKAAAEGDD